MNGLGGDDERRVVVGGAEHKVILELSGGAYERLAETAARRSLSIGQLVKWGLALVRWMEKESSQGHQILIRRGNRVNEVFLPRVENANDPTEAGPLAVNRPLQGQPTDDCKA